ncbi:M15 family metallopeptidase, partial [Pseudomonas sp. 2822-17]|uniref:M15 family metallopeptidase n=1 Tax=Pseudomonas sp. 2822-17 TaxID=1712678 RepID=UPI00117B6A4A
MLLEANEELQEELDRLSRILEEITEVERERVAQLTEETGLVIIHDIDDTIVVDLPYATTNNFVEEVVYPVEVGLL